MKHQALFSLKDNSKKNKSVVCCNFANTDAAANDKADAMGSSIVLTVHLHMWLTLKALNKNCSRRHFNFLLLLFEENKA